MKYKIYIAGASVFRPGAKELGKRYVEICARLGAIGLYPISDDDSIAFHPSDKRGNARKIFMLNISKINVADAIVADMTPFRGPGMDGGTAFEIGAAYMAGKPVIGHGPGSTYMDRAVEWGERTAPGWKPVKDDAGVVYAPDGMAIEDFGDVDNLMMGQAISDYTINFEQAVIRALEVLQERNESASK